MRSTSRPSSRTAASVPAVSARRPGAPLLVRTAVRSTTTTESSTNTASGQPGAGDTSRTCQPASVSARTYSACCAMARSTSTATRSMWVTMPSARSGVGRLTSAMPGAPATSEPPRSHDPAEELLGAWLLRRLEDLLRGPPLEDASLVQEADLRRDLPGEPHLVG